MSTQINNLDVHSYKDNYYEQPELWNIDYLNIDDERCRLEEILDNVPLDIQSILDVGCGNGTFLNSIQKSTRFVNSISLCGTDSSVEALKHVLCEKKEGFITDLPFSDCSYELVTSFEVLEHIKYNEYERALNELSRVSKRYILITVPNNEYLSSNYRKCPECRCHFHPYKHVRSFDKNALSQLFKNKFKCIKVIEVGPYSYSLNHIYINFRNMVYPLRLKHVHICPQCGYQNINLPGLIKSNGPRRLSFLRNSENLLFGKKQKKWLLALYIINE